MENPITNTWHAKSSLLMLGVVLLELFHGQKLETQACWKQYLVNGNPNQNTKLLSAFRWVDSSKKAMIECLGEDLADALSEAILKCICFRFKHEPICGDPKLVDDVYQDVVVPLEKCCPPSLLEMY